MIDSPDGVQNLIEELESIDDFTIVDVEDVVEDKDLPGQNKKRLVHDGVKVHFFVDIASDTGDKVSRQHHAVSAVKFVIPRGNQAAIQLEIDISEQLIRTRRKFIGVKSVGYLQHDKYGKGCAILYNSAPTIKRKDGGKWKEFPVDSTTAFLNSPLIFLEISKDSHDVIFNKVRFYDNAITNLDVFPEAIDYKLFADDLNRRKSLSLEKHTKCSNPINEVPIRKHLEDIYIYIYICKYLD